LARRRALVQARIDTHLQGLIALSGYADPFDLMSLSYEAKLELLLANEMKLIQSKRASERKLRMKGITQSYHMYDSVLYKDSKKAMLELKESLKELAA